MITQIMIMTFYKDLYDSKKKTKILNKFKNYYCFSLYMDRVPDMALYLFTKKDI